MLASGYKNCFWNASGELACLDSQFYGYLGQNNNYPNWQLYTGVKGPGLEAYNPRGYHTAYDTAHTGSTTLDHYYQPHANYNYGSGLHGSRGSCTSCSPFTRNYSQSPQQQTGGVAPYLTNHGTSNNNTSSISSITSGPDCISCSKLQASPNPNLGQQYHHQYCDTQDAAGTDYQDPSGYDRRYCGNSLDHYPRHVFERPNSHAFGGSGWGDSQIMSQAMAPPSEGFGGGSSCLGVDPFGFQPRPEHRNSHPRNDFRPRQAYSYHATNPEYTASDVANYGSQHGGRSAPAGALGEREWRTSRHQPMAPTYIPDYFEKIDGNGNDGNCADCASPDPRYLTGDQNMTAKEHYNMLLGHYDTDPQFVQFHQDRAQYGNAYQQSMTDRQGYPVQSLYGQGYQFQFPDQNQQILASSQNGGAFANYDTAFSNNSILGNQSGGAPSYAMLLMQERPFLNPNPYAAAGSLLGNGNLANNLYSNLYSNPYGNPYSANQPIYIPSQIGTDGYGCQQQLVPYGEGHGRGGRGHRAMRGGGGHTQGINSGYGYGYDQGGYSYGYTYYDCPGGHLLRACDKNFRDKVMKIVKEIGRPQGVSGKNGIKVVWKGERLNKKYRNTFHRVYLIRGAKYPVVTIIRTTIPPEDISKLRFISDKFGVEGDSLILHGPTVKSNLAKMALACMAMRRKITFCSIYDNQLGQKWVWALNPKSPMYKAGTKREYLRVLKESNH